MQKIISFVERNKIFFIVSGILVAVYLVWWLAFYPAVMTSDSFEIWKEVMDFHFKNSNPFLYGLIMFFATRVHFSPSSMAFFQLTTFSALVGAFINYAWKKKVNRFVLVAVVMVFVFWPQFGIYSVTIWKDIAYAIGSLLAGLVTFYYITNEQSRQNKWYLLLWGVSLAVPALFRFNGFFFLFMPATLVLIFGILNWKKTALLVTYTLGFFFLITIGLASAIKVQQVPAMSEGLMIKAVGGLYHVGHSLTPFEQQSFTSFIPESEWEQYYNCQSANELVGRVMKAKNTNSYSPRLSPNIQEDNNFRRAFITATLRNPQGIIFDRACLANNLLGVKEVNNFRYSVGINRGWWQPIIYEHSLFPEAKTFLNNYLIWTTATKHRSDLFWATWPLTIVLVISCAVALVKKYKGLFIYSSMVLINIAIVISLVPAIDYRYVYFAYVCTPFVPILYLLEQKSKASKNKK